MILQNEWNAISARIQGLLDTASLFYQSRGIDNLDPASVIDTHFVPQARDIFHILETYHESHHSTLPRQAADCLERFIRSNKDHFAPSGGMKGGGRWQFYFSSLGTFRSEFTYHLSDRSAVVRRLSERAFLHLQRSIVADPTVCERWRKAFNKREEHCEKLGGAHLLLHGIWAFKVSAEGERTDLVFGEPLRDESEAAAAAEGLVLTEWKVVREPSKSDKLASAARCQASLYKFGVMGGLELAGYAYVVLVSEKRLDPMENVQENNITYRHVNIAVNPSSPSRHR